MRFVHCFTRQPGRLGALIYPSELDVSGPYQGHSALFLMGDDHNDLMPTYVFFAVLAGALLSVPLERQRETASFHADVNGIGKFAFRARGLEPPAYYTGNYPLDGPRRARWQLSTGEHDRLDAAARSHDFYFAGFSPVIADAPDFPLR